MAQPNKKIGERRLIYYLDDVGRLGFEVIGQSGSGLSFDWESIEHISRTAAGRKHVVVPFSASKVDFNGIAPNLGAISQGFEGAGAFEGIPGAIEIVG